jgi:hypothetical protein
MDSATCLRTGNRLAGWRGRALACLAALGTGLGLAAPSHAVQIVVTPPLDEAFVGGALDFEVRVEDLGEEIVAAFDLDFTFDPAVLMFQGLEFGASFGGPAGSFSGVEAPAPGILDFFLFSILPDDVLAAAQGDSVLLARLSFKALVPGSSSMSVRGPADDPLFVLDGREAAPLDVEAVGSALAIVTERAVPEPGALSLLAIGLLAIAVGVRRRRAPRVR